MNKKIIAIIVLLQIVFAVLAGVVFLKDKDLGLTLFLITCVTIPLYICHILSGYISVQMKDFDGASGLLLINIDFIRAVIKFDALDVGLKDKAIYFLVIYAFSILNLLLGFFLRMSY